MVGWNPKPFIFIHIPKCAGTSIEQALLAPVTGKGRFREHSEQERLHYWLPGKYGRQHAKLRRYQRHFDIASFFKFAFVRNPWDRAISQILYLRRTPVGRVLFPANDFKQSLRVYCSTRKTIWAQDLAACQLDFLVDNKGKLSVDFLGRFETLSADFVILCKRLGLEPAPPLPHVFRTKRPMSYAEYFDEESAGWIAARFARDIEAFQYALEPGSVANVLPQCSTT